MQVPAQCDCVRYRSQFFFSRKIPLFVDTWDWNRGSMVLCSTVCTSPSAVFNRKQLSGDYWLDGPWTINNYRHTIRLFNSDSVWIQTRELHYIQVRLVGGTTTQEVRIATSYRKKVSWPVRDECMPRGNIKLAWSIQSHELALSNTKWIQTSTWWWYGRWYQLFWKTGRPYQVWVSHASHTALKISAAGKVKELLPYWNT